ncbi:MAG: SpoIID/LytB domain-containing protein [Deltaproteobacteria bacterium]|nr:SpoIID/LytB domain-containing protein [Deltaproteobacteria bacterium]
MTAHKKLAGLIIPLYFSLQTISCSTPGERFSPETLKGPGINVALLTGVEEVSLSGSGLRVIDNGKDLLQGRSNITVNMGNNGILVDGRLVKSERLAFGGKDISVNGRPYRGSISVIRERGALTVINSLGLEGYLMGIINHEISSRWPLASVKAQAVAARTYAYLKLKSAGEAPYHLKASVLDQVYGGSLSEDERVQKAVNETEGEVLFYEGTIARTLYHSSCGGQTESAVHVWGEDFPYLRSVEDSYCTEAPNYFWIYRTDFASILESLRKKGHLPGKGPHSIKIFQQSESGRIKKILLAGVQLSGNELRELMGYENIKSTLFSLEIKGNEIIFSGSGFGHGVGMCQWGARGMALSGMNYKDILTYYYKGTYIRRVY